ncbi:hypothetical protein P8452_12462 [Trifolium repens]|nr:hypothetical protein P8452_12462 [Trifolium repens]
MWPTHPPTHPPPTGREWRKKIAPNRTINKAEFSIAVILDFRLNRSCHEHGWSTVSDAIGLRRWRWRLFDSPIRWWV